jgi:hypothetical protein
MSWILKSVSTQKSWNDAKVEFGYYDYGLYIYDLSGAPITNMTNLTSNHWRKIDTSENPTLYPTLGYWIEALPFPAPTISLIGSDSITSEKDMSYNDSGATSSDYNGVDLTSSIVVTGSVNINVPGPYTLTYNVSDSLGTPAVSVNRTVTVVDTIIPVITLTGDASVTIDIDTSYNDLGATATDFDSHQLTSSIVVNNPVDVTTAGTYNVTYNVSDVAGNAATEVIRTVIVNPGIPIPDPNGTWTQVGTFVGDLVTNDRLANSALSSDGNIIATSNWMGSGDERGRIRVYQRNGSSWTQIGQDVIGLTGNVPLVSLSSDGTIFSMASDQYDANSVLNVGAVRVFQYNGSSWVQMGQTIKGSNQNDMIGKSRISADGSTLVIASWYNDRSVSVYKYNGSSWIQHGQTLVESGDERYGLTTAINSDGSIIAVSADYADKNGLDQAGTVYVYQDDGSSWVQIGYWEGAINQFKLGYTIGLSSDGTIISMSGRSNHTDAKVRVFKYSNGVWNQLGTDILGPGTGNLGVQDNYFGYSQTLNSDGTIIAISENKGHTIAGGAPYRIGHLYVYQYDEQTTSWSQIGQTMVGENTDDAMGYSVSLNSYGTVVSVGAMFYDSGGVSSVGKVYVYEIPTL